jgi:hypothetical protein
MLRDCAVWEFEIRRNAENTEFYIWRHLVEGQWEHKLMLGWVDSLEKAQQAVQDLEGVHCELMNVYNKYYFQEDPGFDSDDVWEDQLPLEEDGGI